MMESLNKIELQGRVGNIRVNTVGETRVANFSVATDFLYKSRDGLGINETTWFQVAAWDSKEMPDFEKIGKGTPIYVLGRLRTAKYTTSEGVERQAYEVVAQKVRLVTDEEPVEM